MPFRTADPADDIERIREERARVAASIIQKAPVSPGDHVLVSGPLVANIRLVEPKGIVTGYMPANGGQVSVLCSGSHGDEIELQLPVIHVEKVR